MVKSILSSAKPRDLLKVSASLLLLLNVGVVFLLLAPNQNTSSAQRPLQTITQPAQHQTDFASLITAPLFDPTRRAEQTVVAEKVTQRPRLNLTPKGTSISGDHRAVVLNGGDGPIVLREGESRHGIKVIEITEKSIVLETDDGRRTVALAGI